MDSKRFKTTAANFAQNKNKICKQKKKSGADKSKIIFQKLFKQMLFFT